MANRVSTAQFWPAVVWGVMEELTLEQTKLFRLLTSFFGRENVIPLMRVIAICGGSLPASLNPRDFGSDFDLSAWVANNRGLFTIVDDNDRPCLVVEFDSSKGKIVDLVEIEHRRVLKPILTAAGVRYVTITEAELAEIVNPGGTLDLYSFLKAQVESDGEQI